MYVTQILHCNVYVLWAGGLQLQNKIFVVFCCICCCYNRLNAAGIDCKSYGCGSTPGCSTPIDKMSELTEFHPGNYIFYGKSIK